MLRALSIRRIVIADAVDLELGDGLTVLTGETGAGKSILMDSLGLALGARAEAKLAQSGDEPASVVADFELPAGHPVWAMLADSGFESEDDLLLRRRLKHKWTRWKHRLSSPKTARRSNRKFDPSWSRTGSSSTLVNPVIGRYGWEISPKIRFRLYTRCLAPTWARWSTMALSTGTGGN